jgi:uncharacterized protein YcgL (UPF0745 family)
VKCIVYKSRKRQDHYLYVKEEDDLSRVPEKLLALLGDPELLMRLDLTPERRLAQADSREVLNKLDEQGFYLQMPPRDKKHPFDS